ncbi:MAG: hypothetical protein V4560_09820 [Bacteroidota bacterium]
MENLKGILVIIGVIAGVLIIVSFLTHPAKKGEKNSWGDFGRNLWALFVIIIIGLLFLKGCDVI